jgi:NADH-quinone oxidoreductase subunit E
MNRTINETLSEQSLARIKALIDQFPQNKSIVLPVLHIIYEQFGYLDKKAITQIAELTGVPDIYFEEAANFYTMFPLKPTGKYLIQVCRNISCSLLGAEGLIAYLKDMLDIDLGGTTPDGLFSLVTVECLGSCGTAPVMQINDTYYENLTKAKVDQILESLRDKA